MTSCTEPGAESRGGFEEAEGGGRKSDLRWKLANIIDRAAEERRYAIVLVMRMSI